MKMLKLKIYVSVLTAILSVGCQSRSTINMAVGTYGDYIYCYTFDTESLIFELSDKVEARNASYVICDEATMYAVSETGPGSGVYSFWLGEETVMTADKRQTGDDPCFLMLCEDKLLTADYSGGSITVFPIEEGVPGDMCQRIEFSGEGPVKGRQESSHIHQLKMMPRSHWLLVSDLGADVVRLVRIEGDQFTHITDIACPAGSGPRHMEFNDSGDRLYCLAELSGEVLVYEVIADDICPEFRMIQQIQADEVNSGGSADIHIHPSGKYLYTSHRLDNDGICIFEIQDDGTLVKTGYVRTGRHPRNFMITPDGRLLLAACMNDRLIQVFHINEDGSLTLTPSYLTFEDDKPSCLALM